MTDWYFLHQTMNRYHYCWYVIPIINTLTITAMLQQRFIDDIIHLNTNLSHLINITGRIITYPTILAT
jgi:hypothetical protein